VALQKIKFQTNINQELALKFTDGKLCDSQFGDPQWMFTTTDDRCFFVAEKVAAKIHGLRLAPGELFDIRKAEVDYGNGRKGIEWQVSKVGSPPAPAPAIGEQPDGTFIVPGAGAATPAPATAAVEQPSVSSTGNGNKKNGNGHAAAAAPVNPPMPWALFLLNQTRPQIVEESVTEAPPSAPKRTRTQKIKGD
jgi:hypothetical protein